MAGFVNVGTVEGGNTVDDTPISNEVIDEITAPDDDIDRTSETPEETILAITGAHIGRLLGWALVLLLLGAALVFGSRRRRAGHPGLVSR